MAKENVYYFLFYKSVNEVHVRRFLANISFATVTFPFKVLLNVGHYLLIAAFNYRISERSESDKFKQN